MNNSEFESKYNEYLEEAIKIREPIFKKRIAKLQSEIKNDELELDFAENLAKIREEREIQHDILKSFFTK